MLKITDSFHKIWATLVVGPIHQAISAAAPFRDLIVLCQTADSG